MVWFGFEVTGTIAFAISGALAGIQKKLDIFGIVMLAVITAVGGGIIRDIITGNTPPLAFRDPTFVFISVAAAILSFVTFKHASRFTGFIQFCDAIGLGAFTSTGASLAIPELNTWFIMAVLGLTTGVGGGILRDVLIKEIPFVFQREVYAVASLIGASVFYWVQLYFSLPLAIYACFGITVAIRLFCIRWDIHLPTAGGN